LNLPAPFVTRITSQLAGESRSFIEALNLDPTISIRINPEKKISFGDEMVPWCSTGFYLDSRPSFTLDPLFHAGCYYVQDASSMFLEQVFLQLGLSEKKLLILDACAAPGGKSAHLASLMSNDSLLISNEVIGSRITVLKENLIKWGNPNVVITNNDPSAFTSLENLLDVILVDAPCSGEGLFRKDRGAVDEWSETNCELNASRQQRILTALLPALKPGGILIYSTCTFNPNENEKNVKWLAENFEMEFMTLAINSDWGIKIISDGGISGYAFLPHSLKGEGLFISVLKKKQEAFSPVKIKTRSDLFSPAPKKLEALKQWITKDEYSICLKDTLVFALHHDWLATIEFLSANLKTVYSGTCIAELKGEKAIPTHELAMSAMLNKKSFPSIVLSREDALKFLRKEDFKIDADKKGFTLITYDGFPLGWINFLGNRFNNYYPPAWRIRIK
jgi:16S rRNA C967 or C1407 C5-methylase (RsmB/RsmF family)/NOL1/NOP2/fmu family ribosome biogenesis protein